MNSAIKSTEVLFTAEEAAEIAGVDISTLRQLEPVGFGSPGHWRLVNSRVVYTASGIAQLAAALEASTDELLQQAGVCLRVALDERTTRPSRACLPPIAKNEAPSRLWYRETEAMR